MDGGTNNSHIVPMESRQGYPWWNQRSMGDGISRRPSVEHECCCYWFLLIFFWRHWWYCCYRSAETYLWFLYCKAAPLIRMHPGHEDMNLENCCLFLLKLTYVDNIIFVSVKLGVTFYGSVNFCTKYSYM